MTDDPFRKLARDAQFDQAQAGLVQLAQSHSAFYGALLVGGIPESLAADMVRDLLRLQMCKALWPDTPPTFGEE